MSIKKQKEEKRMREMERTSPNSPPRRSLHHHLPLPLPKGVVKLGLVVLVDKIVEPRLASEFIHALGDFVACRVAQPWEEREELAC